jgi:hypothetical protein
VVNFTAIAAVLGLSGRTLLMESPEMILAAKRRKGMKKTLRFIRGHQLAQY